MRHCARVGMMFVAVAVSPWLATNVHAQSPAPPSNATAPAPAKVRPPDLVGQLVPPYPDGLKSNTGACVGSASDPHDVCAYSIATLDDAQDRTLQLLAGQFVDRVGDEARWRITDTVPWPELHNHEQVAIATCQRGGSGDTGVVAVVDAAVPGAASSETLPAVRWAVRLDRVTGKFSSVDPTSVRCQNESFGL